MNNLPTFYPIPETIQYRIPDQYSSPRHEHRLNTPYSSIENCLGTISRLKINVPFVDIITRDIGFSVCPHCKARYVGHELNCQQIVTWYTTSDSSSYCHQRGEYSVGHIFENKEYYDRVVRKTEKRMCYTPTIWDLQKQFDEQQAFFNFVSLLWYIPEEKTDLIAKFGNCLPQGMEDKHRITLLENQILNQAQEIQRLMGGMNQIAQKMQSAGSALCW